MTKPKVYAITSVGRSLGADVHDRTVRYLISMAVRTACVFGVVLTSGWLRWVMIAGAVILPYLAVVAANAGRERPTPADSLAPDGLATAPQLTDGREAAESPRTTYAGPGVPIDLRGGYLR
ncbi:MAG TPA: DUF3099 domain-containing protein [Actinomycetaceae bacterium]|nr:DUF3099 domain-containing protein [Actinomycetaceae bacterium]